MKNRKYLPAVIFLFVISGCTGVLLVQDAKINNTGFSMFGIIPERKFYYDAEIGDSLKLKWKNDTHGSQINTSPVTFDTYIIVPDLAGRIYFFDSNTGKKVSMLKEGGAIFNAPVLYRFRIFYTLNEYNENYSYFCTYNFTEGKKTAEVKINGQCRNELLKLEDGIILLADDGTIYRFDLVGKLEWQYTTNSAAVGTPASNGKILLFGNQKGELISFDLDAQKIIYRNKISSGFESGIAISENEAFIGDIEGNLFSVRIDDGTVKWKFNSGYKIKSIPVVSSNAVFIGNLNGDIFRIGRNKGNRIWKFASGGLINTAPVLFKDNLIQPDLNKKLYIIDALTGNVNETLKFDYRLMMTPIFYDNTLIIGAETGEIYAYESID